MDPGDGVRQSFARLSALRWDAAQAAFCTKQEATDRAKL
jgi:hypothetical protein